MDCYVRFKQWILSEYGERPLVVILLASLSVMFLLSVWLAVISDFRSFVWSMYPDANDTFMDFFNSVMYSSDHPYTKYHVIYPPLITLFYAAVGYFTIPFVVETPGLSLSFELRASEASLMLFFFITALSLLALKLLVNHNVEASLGRRTTYLLYLLLLTSYPVLFALERGNSIILALIGCMLFIAGYRSENPVIRYGSYVALGFSAGIKIFPAIFAALILRERNYREFLICTVIVSAILLVPFMLTDGSIIILAETIFSYSDSVACSNGVLNIQDIVGSVGYISGLEIPGWVSFGISLIITLVSLSVVIFRKDVAYWKLITLISCVLALCFSIGTQYLAVYIIPALLFFIKEERVPTKINIFYLVLFIIVFALIPSFIPLGFYSIGTIKAMAMLALMILIFAECTHSGCSDRKEVSDGQV